MVTPDPYARPQNTTQPPSPGLKSVILTQCGLAGIALLALIGLCALAINVLGNPKAAGPSLTLALVEKAHTKPVLKKRLSDNLHHKSDSHAPDHHVPDDHHASDTHATHQNATKTKVPRITITHNDDDIFHHDGKSLRPAPVKAVHKAGASGNLPTIAPDGQRAAEVYARPYTPSSNAKIGIILGGLGQNARLTEKAIKELPPEITLSFVPYSKNLQPWIDKARAAGHEVLLEIPMEPYDYPNNDPGPHTLLIANNARENKRRLTYLLGRSAGYFGLINYQGSKFVTSAQALNPLLKSVRQYGLAFVHDGGAPRSEFPELATKNKLNFAIADRLLDARPNAAAISEQFLQIEALALENGQAIGAGFAYPVTLAQLIKWSEFASDRGFDLVPVSYLTGIKAQGAPS